MFNNHQNIENYLESKKKRKHSAFKKCLLFLTIIMLFAIPIHAETIVFIGDSYTTYTEPTIPDLVSKMMHMNCRKFCKGKHGIATRYKSIDRRFIALLKYAKKDPKIKSVVIIGGIINDRSRSRQEIDEEADRLFAKIRHLYKNATIYYCMPNWCDQKWQMHNRWQKKILKRITWYEDACKRNKVIFLYEASYSFRTKQNSNYFIEDRHHPSEKGSKLIARNIVNSLTKKSY